MEFSSLTLNSLNFDNFENKTHTHFEDKVEEFIRVKYKDGANTKVESVLSFWFG
jgi:hypothetical protein